MKQLFVMLAMAILPVAVNAQEQAQKAENATAKACCKEGKKDGKFCCKEENKKDPKSCCNKEGKDEKSCSKDAKEKKSCCKEGKKDEKSCSEPKSGTQKGEVKPTM